MGGSGKKVTVRYNPNLQNRDSELKKRICVILAWALSAIGGINRSVTPAGAGQQAAVERRVDHYSNHKHRLATS